MCHPLSEIQPKNKRNKQHRSTCRLLWRSGQKQRVHQNCNCNSFSTQNFKNFSVTGKIAIGTSDHISLESRGATVLRVIHLFRRVVIPAVTGNHLQHLTHFPCLFLCFSWGRGLHCFDVATPPHCYRPIAPSQPGLIKNGNAARQVHGAQCCVLFLLLSVTFIGRFDCFNAHPTSEVVVVMCG